MLSRKILSFVVLAVALGAGIWVYRATQVPAGKPYVPPTIVKEPAHQLPRQEQQILANLEDQMKANLTYDSAYTASGKPKPGTGVCSDVVLEAAQSVGVDLQAEITREVKADPTAYGVERADPGIDHRRCRTMIFWFKKHAEPVAPDRDFRPGDVVFYRTSGKGMVDHVGVVGGHVGSDGQPTLVHHWPGQPVTEIENPMTWPLAGHFRFK